MSSMYTITVRLNSDTVINRAHPGFTRWLLRTELIVLRRTCDCHSENAAQSTRVTRHVTAETGLHCSQAMFYKQSKNSALSDTRYSEQFAGRLLSRALPFSLQVKRHEFCFLPNYILTTAPLNFDIFTQYLFISFSYTITRKVESWKKPIIYNISISFLQVIL